MKSLLLAIIVFGLHYLLVKFGVLFTIPFGFTSLIWPVTGVMLGLYLLFGRAVLAGAALSALLCYSQNPLYTQIPNYFMVFLAITSVLPLILSKILILHLCKLPIKINSPLKLVKALMLIGPAATLIPSVLFVFTLERSLSLPPDIFIYLLATDWAGHAISILFITPVILVLKNNEYVPKLKKPTASILTSLFSFFVLTIIYLQYSSNNHQAKEQEFIVATLPFSEQINVIENTIKHHLTALDGLFQAQPNISREQFQRFTKKILHNNSQLRALGWSPLITEQDRNRFEALLSKQLNVNSSITSLTKQGIVNAPKQNSYLPIFYIEPQANNSAAIGLDVLNHPIVKNTVNKAIKQKTYAVTPLLSLAQQQNKFTGIIVYYPVYKENSHIGIVEVVFELDLLLSSMYRNMAINSFTYQLAYGENNQFSHPNFDHSRLFTHQINTKFFDKNASLSFASTDRFERGLIDWTALLIMMIGAILIIVCVMFVFFMLNFNDSLTKKVAESTYKLMKKNDELSSANQAKILFLANMSHEYRTPLNAIIGFTEIAQHKIKHPQANEYFKKIHNSSNILLNIVNDVLDSSKIQAGELSLESRPFQPAKATQLVIEMLQAKADEKGIELKQQFTEGYSLWLAGDETRFQQIIINLLSNAVKFTQQGCISISGDCQITPEQTGKLTLTFVDTGVGIAEDIQKRLFTPFTQAESSTTRNYGGTGLGLAIVKQLSALMNGHVLLTSELHQGSTFTVTIELPLAEAPIEVTSLNEKEYADFQHAKILVVEDNQINQIVVQEQLRTLNANCDFSDDGCQALIYLEQTIPDLILMDLQMPNMDGFTASQIIKTTKALKHIPIVILSASVSQEDKDKAAALGIYDFINKPFHLDDLKSILNKYLS